MSQDSGLGSHFSMAHHVRFRPEGDSQIFLPIIYHPIPNIA
jgi:hypothetical protein